MFMFSPYGSRLVCLGRQIENGPVIAALLSATGSTMKKHENDARNHTNGRKERLLLALHYTVEQPTPVAPGVLAPQMQ